MNIVDEELLGANKRATQWAICLSALILALITLDIAGDYGEGVPWPHLFIEWGILTLALAGVLFFGWRFYRMTQAKLNMLSRNLALANAQAQHWRKMNRDLIAGLAAQIQSQFDFWQLTRAEAEVGLLLLKGLSLADIAKARFTSERTIRDQARAVYRKSGLSGRAELSAFFLEDLLLPASQPD